MIKTYSAKASELAPRWYVIDAEGQILGRLATQIAQVLRGKHKPTFTPHLNSGDFVIVINAEKIRVTGKRLDQKMYYRHSQYPGGLKTESLRQMMDRKHADRVIQHAVKGMLPHNRLGDDMLDRLKVYSGPSHPHQAQKPVPWGEAASEQASVTEKAEA
jgi:large subunit ribosomal protein L13